MALLDFLKKKKEAEKAKKNSPKSAVKPAKVSVAKEKKEEKKVSSGAPKEKDSVSVKPAANKVLNTKGFFYEAVKKPHISEKATYLSEKDQYIFEVSPNYNKNEVRKAVEGIYGVNVLSINMVKIPHKKRRLGRTEGFRKAYKKAIVKIKNGQKIEIL